MREGRQKANNMSTRSRIGLLDEGGAVRSIYVHHDGYPEGVGATLARCYTRAEDVSALLAGGDTSELADRAGDCPVYGGRPAFVTVARDSFASYGYDCWAEWLYLATPDGAGGVAWEVLDVSEGRTWESLPVVLRRIDAAEWRGVPEALRTFDPVAWRYDQRN